MITLPLSAIVVGSVGWLAKSLLQKQEALGSLSAAAGSGALEISDSYHTFVTVAWHVTQQHPLILGLVLAALLAALMSTIDTLITLPRRLPFMTSTSRLSGRRLTAGIT